MMRLLIGLVLAALCMFPSTASAIMVFPTTFYSAAGGYSANAVSFDGSNDYILRGSGLTGASDGKLGIFSAWVNVNLSDGTQGFILEFAGGKFEVARNASDKIIVSGFRATSGEILHLTSSSTHTSAEGWIHILASWDLGNTTGKLYIDDTDETSATVFTDDDLDYTRTDVAIGSQTTAGGKFNGDMADVYFNTVAYLDLTVESNRRKFIDDNDKPVDLGDTNCSEPTGSQPLICLTNPTATWQNSLGSGQGFTESGALTDAASSPSD